MNYKVNKNQIRYAFTRIIEPNLYEEKDFKILWKLYKDYVIYKGHQILKIMEEIKCWFDTYWIDKTNSKWLHNFIIYDIVALYRGMHHINHFMFHFTKIISEREDIDKSIKDVINATYEWLEPLNAMYDKYFLEIEILLNQWISEGNEIELPRIKYYIELQELINELNKERYY